MGSGIEIERHIRLYDGRPAVSVGAQIRNKTAKNVTLGTMKMSRCGDQYGAWPFEDVTLARGDLLSRTSSVLPSWGGRNAPNGSVQQYSSNGVLAL